MRIFVIGGSGFIGFKLAKELSNRGHKVIIFDKKLPTKDLGDIDFIEGTLLDKSLLENTIKKTDVVYHFAGIADIGDSILDPLNTLNTNVTGTINLLDVISKIKIKQFIFASTMYVYNDLGSFYGASKKSSEIIIKAFAQHYKFPFTMLRYGSLYGPNAQDWNGVRKYVEEIVRNEKIEYKGSGQERREYIHVNDAAKLSADIISDEFFNSAVTVTGQQVLTSCELLEMIFEICNIPKNIEFKDIDIDSTSHYKMTPYQYNPMPALKIAPEKYIDIGQGILEVVREVHEEINEL